MFESVIETIGLRTRARSVRRFALELIEATEDNDLLTYSSAMSYQILFATPAFLLTGLAILGLLDLQVVWEQELAPRLRDMSSPALFDFVQSSVDEVLGARGGFWLTLGAVLALWYVSGATRALMGAMNRIYGEHESREAWRRVVVSVWLSMAGMALIGLAAILLYLGPIVIDALDLGLGLQFLAGSAGWGLTLVCLLAALFLFVRFGPTHPDIMHRRSYTAVAIIAGWLITTLAFRWYVTAWARYESVFGNLASLMIAMVYVHLCTLVMVYGLQLDSMVRDHES